MLQAIILMLFQEAPEYEQNFSMVMRVLEYAEVKEEDEEYISPLDLLFQAIERELSLIHISSWRTPKPSRIRPMARIREKIKSDRLLTTASGSSAAMAGMTVRDRAATRQANRA